jgi:hypothetical protein
MKKSRRDFIKGSTVGATGLFVGVNNLKASEMQNMRLNAYGKYMNEFHGGNSNIYKNWDVKPVGGYGPASKYKPIIMAAIVRRKEDYGMWWPGQIYDGEAAKKRYKAQLKETAVKLGVYLKMRSDSIYNTAEADAWITEVKHSKPDGIILLVLDRQQHSWPTAYKVADTGIPTVIFAPLGCAFHSNTAPLADKPGCVVYSATLEDSGQLSFGMKLLEAGTKIRHSHCIAFRGDQRSESTLGDLGIRVTHLPVQTYIDEVNNIPTDEAVVSMTEDLMSRSLRQIGATREDVENGVKGYFAARKILEREKADSMTLAGCVDLIKYRPCIAWSTMCDEGIPAACEGDLAAIASKTLVQYLFNRPGFQQDPVPDTVNQSFIGAHCMCATKLNGLDQPSEPFTLGHHHGNTDATIIPRWKEGQLVTAVDIVQKKEEPTEIQLLTGSVIDNISSPPNGGCVVSVRYRIDGLRNSRDVLSVPGMHQVFFYGNYEKEISDFCKLYNFKLTRFYS